MNTDNKHYLDLWTKQSQMFWTTVYQVPIIAGTMFAGWFALKSASQDLLAQAILAVGLMSMVVQVLILRRMSQYLNTFRLAADQLIPSVPAPFAGLSGYVLGTAVPALIAVFFLILFIWSPAFYKAPISPSTATATKQLPTLSSLAASVATTPASTPPNSSAPSLEGMPASKPSSTP
jgi:hypothetical protein